jgi:hypothetical protein
MCTSIPHVHVLEVFTIKRSLGKSMVLVRPSVNAPLPAMHDSIMPVVKTSLHHTVGNRWYQKSPASPSWACTLLAHDDHHAIGDMPSKRGTAATGALHSPRCHSRPEGRVPATSKHQIRSDLIGGEGRSRRRQRRWQRTPDPASAKDLGAPAASLRHAAELRQEPEGTTLS